MQTNSLNEFLEANQGRPMKEIQKHVRDVKFSSLEWIELHKMCIWVSEPSRLSIYNLKVTALKKAIETATSLADWVRITDYVKAPYRNRARDEVLKFNITTQTEIDVLHESFYFNSIGWYLNAKRKIEVR